MPRSPQDIYARHLLSPRGYPLWTPEPSHQLLTYRRDGLRIGDVGVVIPEDGCFDVFFNICLSADHIFHRATGVPDNFEPIELDDIDIRTVVNAENPGRIVANSSVKTVRSIERSGDTPSRSRSSRLEYEFNLSSSEGALLILPEGAQRHDLRNHHRFLEAAMRHGADWYRFAEEKVGQIIGPDSLYLITGLYKTSSWSLAAFEKAAGSADYPAQFRLPQVEGGNVAATCTWDTTRALDWRAGPMDNLGIPNQAVFIRGFKIAHRTGMFGTRWTSVKADAPSTRANPVKSIGAVPGDSWLAYIFGGPSTSRTAESSGRGAQDEIVANPALDAARNEIQNNGALAVGEHVVIQRMPEASQAFHPSDIINQYLLNKEPFANIAITHDDEWIKFLEENLLLSEDLVQKNLLEGLASQNYHIVSEEGAVYLQSRSANGPVAVKVQDSQSCFSRDSEPGTSEADATAKGQELDYEGSAMTAVNAIPSFELMTRPVDQDTSRVNPVWTNLNRIVESNSSTSANLLDSRDDKVVTDRASEEDTSFIPFRGDKSRSLPISGSMRIETPPERGISGVHDHDATRDKMTQSTSSMPWVQPRPSWTGIFTTNPSTPRPPTPPEWLPKEDFEPELARFRARARMMASYRRDPQPFDDDLSVVKPQDRSSKKTVRGIVKLNPLLEIAPNGLGEHPHWIMCTRATRDSFRIASADSWVEALNAPAAEPHTNFIGIICRAFPGMIRAHSKNPTLGVTCGEVLVAIFMFLDGDMQREEYERFMREHHNMTAKPGNSTLKRSRWLDTDLFFGGLVVNNAFVKERVGDLPPWQTVLELLCLPGIR